MTSLRPSLRLSCVLGFALAGAVAAQDAPTGDFPTEYYLAPEPSALRTFMMLQKAAGEEDPRDLDPLSGVPCLDGDAAGHPCRNVDLESFLPLDEIGGGKGNDIWGWTDPRTGREYALMGRTTGTSFVDVTDARNPVYLGDLPTHTMSSIWRDIKVYGDHAFVVSEAPDHGMQVFDLRQLRTVENPPVTFVQTAHYERFGSAHNLVMNEDSGFAYAVGTRTCLGGPHMVDVRSPHNPTFAGCVAGDGYTHDAQCVTYHGPDVAYNGREICFNFNEDTITVVDVSSRTFSLQLSRTGYDAVGYTHQGWLTPDHRFLLVDDELDEGRTVGATRTLIWDVSRLSTPQHVGSYVAETAAIDHNQYIHGSLSYQANYRAGLRILELGCLDADDVREVGYFDIYPDDDLAGFNGAWSNYPYFGSGIVIVSGIEQGLYVLRPTIAPTGLVGPSTRSFSGIGNVVRAHRSGDDAVLEMPPAPIDGGYNVYRSESAAAVDGRLAGTPSTTNSTFTDSGAAAAATSYYYQVRTLYSCGLESP